MNFSTIEMTQPSMNSDIQKAKGKLFIPLEDNTLTDDLTDDLDTPSSKIKTYEKHSNLQAQMIQHVNTKNSPRMDSFSPNNRESLFNFNNKQEQNNLG